MEGKRTYLVSWIIAILSAVSVLLDQILGLKDQLQLSLSQVAIVTSLLASIQAGLRSITTTPPDRGILSQSKWFAIIVAILSMVTVWVSHYNKEIAKISFSEQVIETDKDREVIDN